MPTIADRAFSFEDYTLDLRRGAARSAPMIMTLGGREKLRGPRTLARARLATIMCRAERSAAGPCSAQSNTGAALAGGRGNNCAMKLVKDRTPFLLRGGWVYHPVAKRLTGCVRIHLPPPLRKGLGEGPKPVRASRSVHSQPPKSAQVTLSLVSKPAK
jgi:hypothetical protein